MGVLVVIHTQKSSRRKQTKLQVNRVQKRMGFISKWDLLFFSIRNHTFNEFVAC